MPQQRRTPAEEYIDELIPEVSPRLTPQFEDAEAVNIPREMPPMPLPDFGGPNTGILRPDDPRIAQTQQAMTGLDAPRKIGGSDIIQSIGRGINAWGMSPGQFQQQEMQRQTQADSQQNVKRQALAQQLRDLMGQKQQGVENDLAQSRESREQASASREAELAPLQRANVQAQIEERNRQASLPPPRVPIDPLSKEGQDAQIAIASGKPKPQDQSISEIDLFRQTHPQGTLEEFLKMKSQFTPQTQRNIDPLSREGIAAQDEIKRNQEKAKTINAGGAASPYSIERARRTVQSIDELSRKVNNKTVGLGSLASGIPLTDARNFDAELKTLKAAISQNELAQMREASKTGGALGAVSDRELTMLENSLGALDPGQDPANFKSQLAKIKAGIERWQSEIAKVGAQPPAAGGSGAVIVNGFSFPNQAAADSFKREKGIK